mmetsp:Transcript_80194/g.133983  ORF Transcript_80194/g.133983 Transcript_80194/m.133983 type:complete len:207 (-) Transcript_80194:1143-1763(-)
MASVRRGGCLWPVPYGRGLCPGVCAQFMPVPLAVPGTCTALVRKTRPWRTCLALSAASPVVCVTHARPCHHQCFSATKMHRNAACCSTRCASTPVTPAPPKKIHLPRLGSLTRVIRKSRAGRWMCKIDLQNCYCSISLPRSWRWVFVVEVHGVRYKFTRLPFGWRHSPAICHTLVQALVRSALSKVSKAVGSISTMSFWTRRDAAS